MLDLNDVGQSVRIGVGFIALLLAFRFVLRATLVEGFRQRIFALRRELFMLRVNEVVQPTDRSYVLLMHTLNATIRFADRLSLMRFIFTFTPAPIRELPDPLDEALQRAPERDRIEKIRLRLGYELARQMLVMSPLIWPFLPIAYVSLHIVGVALAANDYFSKVVKAVGARPSVKRLECEVRVMFPNEAVSAVTAA